MQRTIKPTLPSNFVLLAVLLMFSGAVQGQNPTLLPEQAQPANKIKPAQMSSADWGQWRGPNRDGKLPGLTLPSSLNEQQLHKAWSIPLSPSYSGPLVVGDRVFTTQTIKEKFEAVTAHDRNTGEMLWQQQWEGAMSVFFIAKANGDWIRATPAYDQGRLYVAGMRDRLVCLNANDGKVEWELDFPKETNSKVPSFGCVSSPLVDGEGVYVQAGEAIFKLNKLTGEVIWKAGEHKGAMKWRKTIKAFRGMNIITPTIDGDSIFVSSYGGNTALLKLVASDGKFDLQELWTLPAQGYMCTPVIIDGYAYTHLKNQRFACYDLKNGVEKWKTKRFGKYASLIAVGDKIMALDANGWLMLLKANPEAFELLDKRKVGSDNWAHLALQGSQVFIRGLEELTMYQWADQTP